MSAPLRAQVGKDGAKYELFGGEFETCLPHATETSEVLIETLRAASSRLPPRSAGIRRALYRRCPERVPVSGLARA